MRLQHSRSSALYRDWLQAATLESIVFAFRKFSLGLAHRATATSTANTLGMGNGWNDDSVQEKDSCSKYEQYTFHDCFLLVRGNWIVIFS